jgi:F-type H+-transporting ATPase subunit a
MNHKVLATFLIAAIVSVFSSNTVYAQNEEHGNEQKETEKFEPGSFIINHIGDSHEWHIVSLGERNIAVPLPVILYSKVSGWHFFSASRLMHEQTYLNFKLEEEGKYKGKIVEVSGLNENIETNESVDSVVDVPLDLSITKNVVALWVSIIILIWVFTSIAKAYKKNPNKAPKGLQSFIEPVIIFVRDDIAIPSVGKDKYEKYIPYLLTIFFFIFLNNLLGLIPIPPFGANLTGNIAVTMVMAIFTFAITSFSGNRAYWQHMINMPGVPWWLKLPVPLMPIVEISGAFIKPFVLMIRLFANITAGHIIALGFYSLIFIFGHLNIYAGYGASIISISFTVFMGLLELLVAFIQAYVFTLLSAIYFGMATEEHHH